MRCVRAIVVGVCILGCAAGHELPADAGGECTWVAPPPETLFCNFAGETPCDDWAASVSTSGRAMARCALTDSDAGDLGAQFRCASADRCVGAVCYCGATTECSPGSACMRIRGQSVCIGCRM